MDQAIRHFFEQYEKANVSSDLAMIGSLYADTFMFGGAKGVQAVKKEDFLKVLPKMKAQFASMGLSETRLQTVKASAIDAKYFLAKTVWKITVRDLSGGIKQVDVFATYVLERKESGTFCIVFQIDHQDLATVIKGQQTRG